MRIKKGRVGVQLASLCFHLEQTESQTKDSKTSVWHTDSCWNNKGSQGHKAEWRGKFRTRERRRSWTHSGSKARVQDRGWRPRQEVTTSRERNKQSSRDCRDQNQRLDFSVSWWERKTENGPWHCQFSPRGTCWTQKPWGGDWRKAKESKQKTSEKLKGFFFFFFFFLVTFLSPEKTKVR